MANTEDQAKYDGDYRISFDDTPAVDAFGRLRVSLPRGIFEYQNQYDKSPLIWDERITGTGTSTHLPLESSVELSTGGLASGASVVRQTRQYFRYRPGRSILLLFTGVLGRPTANTCARAGYYDDRNGAFFLADETGFSVVIRSDTSGAVVDTVIPQSEWNVNKLDGINGDNIDVDPTKAIIGWIDLEWLGVGRVRFGIIAFGKYYTLHEQNHTNKYDKVYMRTANLPIRYEVDNHGIATEITKIKCICANISIEGDGDPEQGYDFAVDTDGTLKAFAATNTAMLSIRPKATFKGQVNRAGIMLKIMSLISDTRSFRWALLYNPAITGGAWVSVDDASTVEYNVTQASFTGGITIESGFVPASNQTKSALDLNLATRYPFALDSLGANPTNFTIVIQGIGGLGSAGAGISWREFY